MTKEQVIEAAKTAKEVMDIAKIAPDYYPQIFHNVLQAMSMNLYEQGYSDAKAAAVGGE